MAAGAEMAVMPAQSKRPEKPDDAVAYVAGEKQWLNPVQLRHRIQGFIDAKTAIYEAGLDPLKMKRCRIAALAAKRLLKQIGKAPNDKVDGALLKDPMDYEEALAAEINKIAPGLEDDEVEDNEP